MCLCGRDGYSYTEFSTRLLFPQQALAALSEKQYANKGKCSGACQDSAFLYARVQECNLSDPVGGLAYLSIGVPANKSDGVRAYLSVGVLAYLSVGVHAHLSVIVCLCGHAVYSLWNWLISLLYELASVFKADGMMPGAGVTVTA